MSRNTCMYFLVTYMLHTYVTYIFLNQGTNHKMSVNKHGVQTKQGLFVIEQVDGRQKAVCNKCGLKPAYSGGTGNLLAHTKLKHPDLSEQPQTSGRQLT